MGEILLVGKRAAGRVTAALADGWGTIPAERGKIHCYRDGFSLCRAGSACDGPLTALPGARQDICEECRKGRIALPHFLATLPVPERACDSVHPETGEECAHAVAPHGKRQHISLSGDEWTDESGTYCAGDVDCTCWDHRQAAAS